MKAYLNAKEKEKVAGHIGQLELHNYEASAK